MKDIELNPEILSNKLLNLDYYTSKFSMFMSESYGILEQIRTIYFEWLKSTNDTIIDFSNRFNIFNPDYDEWLIQNYNDDSDEFIKFTFLDTIAAIVNVTRNIKLYNTNLKKNEYLELNNRDLLKLIKLNIIKFYFDGTMETLLSIYKNIDLPILIYTDLNHPASANVYIDTSAINEKTGELYEISENIKKIFLYTDLFIESLGILYNKAIIDDVGIIGIADSNNSRYCGYSTFKDNKETPPNKKEIFSNKVNITDPNGNILSDVVVFYQYDDDDIIQLPINWEIKNNNITSPDYPDYPNRLPIDILYLAKYENNNWVYYKYTNTTEITNWPEENKITNWGDKGLSYYIESIQGEDEKGNTIYSQIEINTPYTHIKDNPDGYIEHPEPYSDYIYNWYINQLDILDNTNFLYAKIKEKEKEIPLFVYYG